jgi:N-acyl-D-amino-acid deacylase
MFDLLIRGGTVYDGLGTEGVLADVAVTGDRISAIEPGLDAEAVCTINASGLAVAPGFIDPHTHSDLTLLVDGQAQSKIRQGVTTEVVANCGMSFAPLQGAAIAETEADTRDYGLELTWRTMGEYLARLRAQHTAVNVVALVGHNIVRGSVLGYDDVQPTAEQQLAMERLVAEAMEQGARGLSTGLFYPPGFYAKTPEVIGLARVAARYGGIYASHIRSESDLLFPAVSEAIEIGEKAGIRVEIAHLKLEGYENWEGLDQLFALLDDGVSRGVTLGCDQYPYDACSTWLGAILPYWAQAGGNKAVADRLRQPEVRQTLREDYRLHQSDWDNRSGVREWSEILVVDSSGQRELQGLNIDQIAVQRGVAPLEAALDLIMETEGTVSCVYFDQQERNVRAIMRHPSVVVGSDGRALANVGSLAQRKTHPRSYGTFPRVLGRYVRDEGVLTLPQGIQKMTSITAERFNLVDRGVLRRGAYADIAVFDPATVADAATFVDPDRYAVGIPYVVVNGSLVIADGEHTGALPGRVLA